MRPEWRVLPMLKSLFRNHRGITPRVVIVSGVITLILGAAFVLLIVAVRGQRDAGQLALRSQEAITAGSELQKSVITLENGLRGYVASGKERTLDPWEQGVKGDPGQGRGGAPAVAGGARHAAQGGGP